MKKRSVTALAALLLAVVLALSAFAGDQAGYVYDKGGLLTSGELQALEERAGEISEEYGCGVYIVIVDDYEVYPGGRSVEDAAEALFTKLGLGLGQDQDGIVLLLSMEERDYDLCAHGYGNYAFTDYGKELLAEEFLDDFRRDNWYDGFSDYLDACEQYLDQAVNGTPVDTYGRSGEGGRRSLGSCIAVGLVVGCLAGLIVCMIQRAKMRSVHAATGARDYAVPGSLNLYQSSDVFSHVTESRVVIESDSDRGGGGGGTTVNSGGFSHSSGKF